MNVNWPLTEEERPRFLQHMALGQLDAHMRSTNLDTDLTPFTNTRSMWLMGPNVKWKL